MFQDSKKTEKSMDILLVGTGAVGGLYGGKLAQAGAKVSVLCRSDYHEVKKNGISVISHWGDFHFTPERVIRETGELDRYPDIIIVALKVLPEIDLPAIIKSAVGPQTAIALIQNGVEIEEKIASAFPENRTISGLVFVCVSREAPGKIRHLDYGRMVLGDYPTGISQKTEELARLFQASGVPCSSSEDIVRDRWEKLVWNAPFSPLSVLGGGMDTNKIMGSEESVNLVRKVMEEVCAVARAWGHDLSASVVEKNIEDTMKMRPYKTSMCLDFEAGRPMEVESILGNAVRAAGRKFIPVPHLESLYILLQLVDKNRGTSI